MNVALVFLLFLVQVHSFQITLFNGIGTRKGDIWEARIQGAIFQPLHRSVQNGLEGFIHSLFNLTQSDQDKQRLSKRLASFLVVGVPFKRVFVQLLNDSFLLSRSSVSGMIDSPIQFTLDPTVTPATQLPFTINDASATLFLPPLRNYGVISGTLPLLCHSRC